MFIIIILSTFDSEFSENFNIIFLFFKIFELQFSEKLKCVKVLIEKNNELNKKVCINSNVLFIQLKKISSILNTILKIVRKRKV